MQRDLYTVDELSQLFSMSRRSVWEHIRKGHIPGGFKVGRRVYVKRDAVEKMMEASDG